MQMMFQPFLRFYIKYSVSRVTPVATVRFQPFLRFYAGCVYHQGNDVIYEVSTLLEILLIKQKKRKERKKSRFNPS